MYSVDYVLMMGVGDEEDQVVQLSITDYLANPDCAVLLGESWHPSLAPIYNKAFGPNMVQGHLCHARPCNMLERSVLLYDEVAAWALYRGLRKTIPGCGESGGWKATHVIFGDWLPGGKKEVMLVEQDNEWHHNPPDGYESGGPAYTLDEWEMLKPHSFECINGKWLTTQVGFEGEPLPSVKVVPVEEAAREAAIRGLRQSE